MALLGAFRRLALLQAAHVGARIVLVDFGPSSGVLNQVFVMSCDYILPPCFADYYSICSADGFLRTLLPSWIKWQREVLAKQVDRLAMQEDPANLDFAFRQHPPRILPFLVTAYKMFYAGKAVAAPSSQWILDLKALAESDKLPAEVKVRPLRGSKESQSGVPALMCTFSCVFALSVSLARAGQLLRDTLAGARGPADAA